MKSYGVTIQMKATEQYFPVVLFIMRYKVVLTFESVDEIPLCVTFQMRPIRWNFAWYYLFQRIFVKCVVLFLVTSTELPRTGSRGARCHGKDEKLRSSLVPLRLNFSRDPCARLPSKIPRGARSSQLDTT